MIPFSRYPSRCSPLCLPAAGCAGRAQRQNANGFLAVARLCMSVRVVDLENVCSIYENKTGYGDSAYINAVQSKCTEPTLTVLDDTTENEKQNK